MNKKIFNVLTIIGFFIVLGSLICLGREVYSMSEAIKKDFIYFLNAYSNNNFMKLNKIQLTTLTSIMAAILILLLFFIACVTDLITHECGHSIIFIKNKVKPIIVKVEWFKFKTIPKEYKNDNDNSKRFNSYLDDLLNNNSKMYVWLCISGVLMNTILSVLFCIILISIKVYSLIWILSALFVIIFNLFTIFGDYISCMWSKNPTSDGQRLRKILK